MNNVNKLFNLALAFLIISCSGGDDSSPSTPPDNGGGDDSITEITLNFNKLFTILTRLDFLQSEINLITL